MIKFKSYFIYSLLLLPFLVLFLLNQKIIFSSSQSIRRLVEEDKDNLKNLCSKYEDLYKHYYEDVQYIPSEVDFGQMSEGSYIILDFLDNNYSGKYLLRYLWYTNKYTAFFIILLLIVIFTIYYNISSFISFCRGKCCCNIFSISFCKNKIFQTIACIIAPLVYIVVLILASASISYSTASLNRFAGTVCVGFQFVDSLIDGETKQKAQKWGGIDVVSDILTNLAELTKQNNQEFVKIIYDNKKLYDEQNINWAIKIELSKSSHLDKTISVKTPKIENIEERNINILPEYAYNWEDIIDDIDTSGNIHEVVLGYFFFIEKYFYKFFGCEIESDTIHCNENSKISVLFEKGADLISYLRTPLKNIRNILVKPIENIYEGINNVLYYFFVIVVIFVIIYCATIVLLLGIFFCSKRFKNERDIKSCIRWNLCHIYFMSLLIVIVGFIVGIGIGFIGNLVKDMTNVIEYITRTDNLKSENPIIFGKTNVTKYLDVCLNGDGNLARELNLEDNFDYINQLINITDDSDDLTNKTINFYSPVISEYLKDIENSIKNYLNTTYIDSDKDDNYNIQENLIEINNYVSGLYSQKDISCKLINETWDITKEKAGYIYNDKYPVADEDNNYLIYLYDDDVYNKANILTDRYINACPTPGKPYETVNEASQNFGKFFYDIKNQISSDKFNKEFCDDLNELNEIYSKKNKYINKSVLEIEKFLAKIDALLHNYATNKDGIFSLLNCKFVGENKLILMSILYTSLGVYLDKYGTLTSLWSFFIFIALIFVLIVIRNYDDDNISSDNLENINNELKSGVVELQMKSESKQELIE